MDRREDGKPPFGHHRDGDANGALVGHFRAADSGISMGWRWVQIIVTVLCAAFVAGMSYAGFDMLKTEMVGMRGDVSELKRNYAASDKQNALLAQKVESLEGKVVNVERENRELRGTMDTMRNMREAYVYATATRKQPQSVQTPP